MRDASFSPETIYQQVMDSVEILLITLDNDNTDPEIIEYQQEAKDKLGSLHDRLQETLQSLEKNSEWDVFTIAFYGETNAGKSTLIETLRILLHEQKKVQEREQYADAFNEYQTIESRIAEIENNLKKLERSNETNIQSHEDMIAELDDRSRALETLSENKESRINHLQYELINRVVFQVSGFIKSMFNKLDEQIERDKLEPEIVELNEEVKTLGHEIQQQNEQINDLELVYHDHRQAMLSKIAPLEDVLTQLDEILVENSDGHIVGDGRSDFTQIVSNYRFTKENDRFSILDLPGIEGKEEIVQNEINAAVEKAHVVFYVSGKATPPQKGSNERLGTVEKIGEQLHKQSEIYFIYNKRAKNPRQLTKELISTGEAESLEVVDQVMQDTLGERYANHISLSAYPALVSVANDWDRNFGKSKEKFLETFGSADVVLEHSQVAAFSKWMTTDLVLDIKEKIVASNIRKITLSLGETKENIHEASGIMKELEGKLASTLKDISFELNETGEILKDNISNGLNKSMRQFETRLRKGIYSDIDQGIKNEESEEKLKERTEEEAKRLEKNFHKHVTEITVQFKVDVENIVKKHERYVDELLEVHASSVDFNFEFNPEIKIENNVNVPGAILSILTGIGGVVMLMATPVGVPVLMLSVLGLLFSAAKTIASLLNKNYRKSQQRKIADDYIVKISNDLRERMETEIKGTTDPIDKGIDDIKKEIGKSVRQVEVMIGVFQEAEDELTLMATEMQQERVLSYGNN